MAASIKPEHSSGLSLLEMLPHPTNRALIVGQTGSGKTTLARLMLQHRRYVVLVDFKGSLRWPEYQVHTTLRSLAKSTFPRLCYRPTFPEMHNDNTQEMFWEWLYRRKNTTVYVDETFAVTRGESFPMYYGACLTRGREMGLEMWSATQRPMRIPQIVLSESEQVYAFKLKLPQDRKRMEELTGIPEETIFALPKHEFVYAPQDAGVFGPFRLNLR